MRPWPVVALVVPALTCVEPSPDLALDVQRRCTDVAVEVRDAAVLPGWTVHALVVLDRTGTEAWALATDPDKRLMLKGWPTGPGMELTALGEAGMFALVPGPVAGEAWLILDRPTGARVWRLGSAARGEGLEAPDIMEFPGGDQMWTRRLIFVDEAPYVLAVPSSGNASTLTLPLARIDRETLAVNDRWDIDFWWTCAAPMGDYADTGCVETPYEEIPSVELLAVTQADGAGQAAALIGLHAVTPSETPEQDGVHYTVVSSLELRPTAGDGPPDAFRHDRWNWMDIVPLAISPAHVAADGDDLYMLVGSLQPPEASLPALLKDFMKGAPHASARGSGNDPTFAQFDKDLRSHLLQIGGKVALGQFSEGKWLVAPIERDAEDSYGFDESLVAGLPVPDGTVVRGAGFGQFLVRPPDGPAQQVTLVCVAEDGA